MNNSEECKWCLLPDLRNASEIKKKEREKRTRETEKETRCAE